jgi:parallel beta-helix repeat protein
MSNKAVSGMLLTLLLIWTLFLTFKIQSVNANVKTILVPDDYPTIQEAINAARDEDIILVSSGTYYEHVVVNKSIWLVGQDRSNTTVDGAGNSTILAVTKDNIKITGFTIQNSDPFHYPNAGIYIQNNVTDCNITKNNIRNNLCGILIISASNNIISDNNVIDNKDGFFLWTARNNSIIANNIANNLHAIELDEGSENLIFHNNFVGNTHQIGIETPLPQFSNVWDAGYPFGGNYWNDYNGTDFHSGPSQNITGGDGIGDAPYVIGAQDIDHYPFMKFYGANFTEFGNMSYHGFDESFLSMKVSGTVTLYDDYDLKPSADGATFFDTSVPNLADYPRSFLSDRSKAVKSLDVSGTVTLYEEPNYAGRTITFTSDTLPYENIGTEWNKNPNLIKNESAWDCRTWNWGVFPSLLDVSHGDQDNYVTWDYDGLVVSGAQDGAGDPLKASNFDQGYERFENEIYNLSDWDGGWSRRACSLRVEGNVTLYEDIGYGGASTSFASDANLTAYGWARRASSLKLTRGSHVTLYQGEDFTCPSISFVYPMYQPHDLKVSDKQTITLEAVVHDWSTDNVPSSCWTGAKFDVFAVEDRYDHNSKTLMLELYFLRTGFNLAWQLWPWPPFLSGSEKDLFRAPISGNNYNYLVAIDAFPEFVERIVYPGDTVKWKIDVKSFIERACNHTWWVAPNLDISKLSIVKMSFTLEAAWMGSSVNPAIRCSLDRLRLAYTKPAHAVSSFYYFERTPRVNETVTFDATGSYVPGGNYTSYVWDFGDGNTVTTTQPIVNHTYFSTGNYKVTLNTATDYGLWNTTSHQIMVTFKTDLNRDGRVNIQEIAFVAAALGSKPGDPRWNVMADVDGNGEVNIIDVVMIAIDYGKVA